MRTVAERFWPKVNKTDGCWLWTASTYNGYGQFGLPGNKVKRAHHVAWFLTFGVWPSLQLCHKCDVPACVNPAHLFEGTQKDNMQDMVQKGRHGGGARPAEGHHLTKLTWDIVRDIRTRLAAGEPYKSVLRSYPISASTLANVRANRVWKEDL